MNAMDGFKSGRGLDKVGSFLLPQDPGGMRQPRFYLRIELWEAMVEARIAHRPD